MTVNVMAKHDVEVGIGEYSSWGTPATTATSFTKQHAVPTMITPSVNIRQPDRINDGRQPLDEDIRVDTDLQEHVISISGQVTKETIAEHIYAVMQAVTEDATTPYQKVFTPAANQPDFDGASEGMFASIVVRPRADQTSCRIIDDAIGRSINLRLHPSNDGGRLAHTTEWFGRTFTPNKTISAGDMVARAVDYFNYSDLVVQTVGGTTFTLAGFNITQANNASGAGIDADDLSIYRGVALGMHALTGTISFMWEQGLETLLATPDTVHTLIFTWGSTGNDGYLHIEIECKFGAATVEEGEHRIINIPIIGCKETNGMLRITLADALDRTW